MKAAGRCHGGEAAVAVEFALLLPVLLILLLGVMEGGRVLSAWVILTNETREAARYGVAGIRDGDASLVSEVNAYARGRIGQTLNLANLTLNTSVVAPGATAGSITVAADYTVNMVTPLMTNILGNVTVAAQSTMRTE